MDSSSDPHKYDMIISRLVARVRNNSEFFRPNDDVEESTVRMKDPEEFADISSPLHEFFWHCECYETLKTMYALFLDLAYV
jgi:hypothetical protein